MRKAKMALIVGVLCLCLSGCGFALPPEKAADGLDWDKNWVTVGRIIGVDTPDGMEAQENNEALEAQGMGYATRTHNGQEFSVITYSFDSETNPYARGASAYGVYRNYAVSVEFVCRQDFDGDAA